MTSFWRFLFFFTFWSFFGEISFFCEGSKTVGCVCPGPSKLVVIIIIIIIIIWFGDTVTVSHSTKCDTNSKVCALREYAKPSRCVFKCFAKVSKPKEEDLKPTGKAFQLLGPATTKDLKPQSVRWLGTTMSMVVDCKRNGFPENCLHTPLSSACRAGQGLGAPQLELGGFWRILPLYIDPVNSESGVKVWNFSKIKKLAPTKKMKCDNNSIYELQDGIYGLQYCHIL